MVQLRLQRPIGELPASCATSLLADDDNHLARDTDTEIIHARDRPRAVGRSRSRALVDVMRNIARRFDGAYSLVFLNALGDMLVARDPLGIKPLCYAMEGPLFAAASESVALLNLGFAPESIKSLLPGQAVIITDGRLEMHTFRPQPAAGALLLRVDLLRQRGQHDGRPQRVSVAQAAGRRDWPGWKRVPIDDDTIVVPVPDTSKAAADAMAFKLKVPSLEGLIRNRYTGRTFIEGSGNRKRKAETKYTPLREVLEGKRVLLVEDSIVRSTTMKVLLKRIRELGRAREIHVRVACPPIIAPCFYGIDMSTIDELFAPQFLRGRPIDRRGPGRDGRHSWGPIRSAICPSSRSPGRSASTATSSARPASPATIRRPAGRSSIKSPSAKPAKAAPRAPTSCGRVENRSRFARSRLRSLEHFSFA